MNEKTAKVPQKKIHPRLTASLLLFIQIILFASYSCNIPLPAKNDQKESIGNDGAPLTENGFSYRTVNWLELNIHTDYPGIQFRVFDDSEKLLALVITNKDGFVSVKFSVPITNSGFHIRSGYIGIPNEIYLKQDRNPLGLDLRKTFGSRSANGGIKFLQSRSLTNSLQQVSGFPPFSILGSWNYQGVPDYLGSSEMISNSTIAELNSILPEKQPVPEYRPQYLIDNLDTDLHIVENGEVFVTFVHEGAGYKNSLGFYTYATADGPPTAIAAEDITLIFPNVSYTYSGGGLQTGDTVKIGPFTEGTSIGWVLLSNAFSSRFEAVSSGIHIFYSENDLNPDTSPWRQHVVQIDLGNFIAIGFEDLLRPGGDNDFNDAVFTVKSNPVEAIDRSGLIRDTGINYTAPDTAANTLELQEDPLYEISGYQFFPGMDEFATLAFEDLWPHKGDYDFNDLVIDYNIIETLNTDNKIIQIQISLKIVGIIASMHNGFGIQLGIPPELVASVSGARYTKGYTFMEPNGTEKRQEKAVIIIFEDAQNHYDSYNPDESEPLIISINLLKGVTRSELGFAPYNPFIMSNGERGREIHLPGYQATSLVHIPYFGSNDDDSIIGTAYMYKTKHDLPWAIHLPEPFAYPFDSIKIYDAYPLFNLWANSDGFSHSDWYSDKPGYRLPELIMRSY